MEAFANHVAIVGSSPAVSRAYSNLVSTYAPNTFARNQKILQNVGS